MSAPLAAIFASGFFGSEDVRVAAAVGAVVALVAGAIGVFTVIRGQSFAGHALADIGATGGSGAFLAGVGLLWGFVVIDVLAAAVMELIGIQRPRGRDLATGIVLGAGLGVAALILYFDATYRNTTGAAATVLFGSIFAIPHATVALVGGLGAILLVTVAVLYRPLLLSSLNAEMAAARGIRVRLVGAIYLFCLAIAVALAAMAIGAILSTALLIGPAATALRLTKRPGLAMLTAGLVGIGATWLGILLAYDSYSWPPLHHGWPVSFFVVTSILIAYLLAGLPALRRSR